MYSCNYDVYPSALSVKNDKPDERSGRGSVCISSLFYSQKPCYRWKFYVNVDNDEVMANADWFEKNVIEPLLIDRVKGAFTVTRGWERKDDAELQQQLDRGCKPWVTVDFDGTKITSADCYVVTCLYRYSQEFPELVSSCKKMMTKEGVDLLTAFVRCHSLCGNSNHGILGYKMSYLRTKTFKNANWHKLWEDLKDSKDHPNVKTPMSVNPNKGHDLSGYFELEPDDVEDEEAKAPPKPKAPRKKAIHRVVVQRPIDGVDDFDFIPDDIDIVEMVVV